MDKFRHLVKQDGHVIMEITAYDAHHFSVRYPSFDDIRQYTGCGTDFNQDQLTMFLLALDPKECLKFLKRLYDVAYSPSYAAFENRFRHNVLLGEVWEEVIGEKGVS